MSSELTEEIGRLVPRLRRFGYALCGNRADGDDLVQIACEKALTRLQQFQRGTRLDSWMFRIMQTSWIDILRRRKREAPAPADDEGFERISDDGKGAADPIARLQLQRVRQEIAALPEDQRAVIALVAIEGCSYKEAAEILDTPIGTIMSRLARARARLQTQLEEPAR